jgi:hypothetical protein
LAEKFYNCSFGDYKGRCRYVVKHPKFKGELIVRAPDDNAAIKAAGDYWGEDWIRYEFYAYCDAVKV